MTKTLVREPAPSGPSASWRCWNLPFSIRGSLAAYFGALLLPRLRYQLTAPYSLPSTRSRIPSPSQSAWWALLPLTLSPATVFSGRDFSP